MSDTVFTRRDDHRETVIVTGQERTPNGNTYFRYLTPASAKDKTGQLNHYEFDKVYVDLSKEPQGPPQRPSSADGVNEWRRWALHLEHQIDLRNQR